MKSASISGVEHGGSLAKAESLFPDAPRPFVDLSTGINPHAYPLLSLPATVYTRLPEPADAARLQALASSRYGAPSAEHVVLAAGTQIVLPMIYGLRAQGRVAVLGPTYEEHARAARIAGHEAHIVAELGELPKADIAVVVNPNNPDGRVTTRAEILALAAALDRKGGLLVVDEAFMDVGPRAHSVAGDVGAGNIVVLRSFGKFFGLAGVRLGFVVSNNEIASQLRAQLGPWAVSGPALAYGLTALADKPWQETMRARLHADAGRLHALLETAGGTVSGSASLYRHLRLAGAGALFQHLGMAGIYVRAFADRPDELRVGLPADDNGWQRLAAALDGWNAQTGKDFA